MPNIVKVTVDQSGEVLNAGAYGASSVIRLQTSATEAGTYADVSGTGSTPTLAIVDGTRIYTGYDPNGITSSWYRTRFENVGATRVSDWSTAFQVGGEEAGQLCSLYDVKQRLGKTAADTAQDELILEFIGRVSTGIMGYTGRRFARSPLSGTTTFLFDIRRTTKTLWVPKGIAEMSQLEVATQTGGAFTVVPTADWFLDPPETERDHGWPATRITLSDIPTGTVPYFYAGKLVVRTTMAEGWATVPGDIAGIAEDEVIRRYQGRGQGYTAAESGEGFIRLLRANAPEDAKRLAWYRNIEMV